MIKKTQSSKKQNVSQLNVPDDDNRIRILLIEDSVHDRIAIKRSCRKCSLPVTISECQNGKQAISKMASNLNFDIIVCDYRLQGINGMDIFHRIRRNTPEIPFILLTGYGSESLAAESIKAGVDEYLVKDVGRSYLEILPLKMHEAISRHIDRIERRKAEEALVQSEERFRLFFEYSPLGFQTVDKLGCLENVNPAWLDILGYSLEDVIGRPFKQFLSPKWKTQFDKFFAQCQNNGQTNSKHLELLRSDGEVIDVEFDSKCTYDKNGSFICAHGIFRDITERKKTEETLRESEKRFRELVNTTPAMIGLINKHGKAIFFSRAWLEFTGSTMKKQLGNGWKKYIHPEDLNNLRTEWNKVLANPKKFQVEFRLKNVSGKYHWMICTSQPKFNHEGQFDGYLCSSLDISSRKEVEEFREDIERLTRHDLKNPLNYIINIPSILKSTIKNLSPYHKQMLQLIQDSGEQMLNTINLSLELNKMEYGNYHFEPVKINIVPIIFNVFDALNIHAEMKNLKFSLLIDHADAKAKQRFFLNTDEFLFYSLMLNLIKNAVEASPKDSDITVAMISENPKIITVHNYGTIPKDIRGRFFEKYVTSGKPHGTGLGAYSARLIVEVHGGVISMQSADATGTTIRIELPED